MNIFMFFLEENAFCNPVLSMSICTYYGENTNVSINNIHICTLALGFYFIIIKLDYIILMAPVKEWTTLTTFVGPS